jgi:phage tail-like protein
MDANGLNFRMLSQQQDWPLSADPAAGAANNPTSLSAGIGAGDTQIVLLTPLPGGPPDFVLVDSEVMNVSGVDTTGLQLGVTRGAQGTTAANHPAGALVWGPAGLLRAAAEADATVLTIATAPNAPTTTAPPATTPATTTPAPTAPKGLAPGVFLQIGSEFLIVAQIDWTGMQFTVTRGALGTAPAAYCAGSAVFAPLPANTLHYCPKSNRLRLISMRLGNPPLESFAAASALVETVPMARDSFGNYARWDPIGRQVMAGGSAPGEVSIYTPPAGQAVTDLAMGNDGILYIAAGGSLVLADRRDRWPNATLTAPGFAFWRLAALPDAGVLALDRAKPQLGMVTGVPLQTGPTDTPDPGILRSCQANPTPPQLSATWPLAAGESFVGLANFDQQFAILSWAANSASNTAAFARLFDPASGLGLPWKLGGAVWPYSLAWLGDMQLAVLATGLNEALIYNLAESGPLVPAGETYILTDKNSGPFAHGLSLPPYYAGGNRLGLAVPLKNGTASLATSVLGGGIHAIAALYSGDRNNPPAASAMLAQNVAASASNVTLSASVNPSVAGQAVVLKAGVTPHTATGTITFADGATTLGSAALSGGTATLSAGTLAPGLHSITAAYGGDGSNPAGASAVLVQNVSQAAGSVALTSTQNPSATGQGVTFTAVVSPATATGTVQFVDGTQPEPLLPLSLNSLAAFGSTDPRNPKILDSGISQAVWHRVFLEAALPPRCSVVVWLTAADQPSGISAPSAAWYPHAFGDADMSALPDGTPQGVWLSIPCEVPFAQPMLNDMPVRDRQGLFMALIQRNNRVVRNLRGRFLGIRVELQGDRRSTPEIAALRVWSSRFSYVGNYLPELYRENKYGADADATGNSTRRDFFERFVNIFEAQMTRIEDRVAHSYLLTRSESTPDGALDWLGGWVGLDPDGYPPDRRRARLEAASMLHKYRGTAKGVTLALDIATNGLCTSGAIVVIEDFRLRHIFATILGADLSNPGNPLLPGLTGSSNSFVGDTLFLGNPRDQAEVLALFSPELPESPAEQSQLRQLFDALANRMTVFVHNQAQTVDLNLVQRIVEQEKPAHVAAAIRVASQPFMVGLAALVGADSYLAPDPPREPVVVGASQIGRYNMVIQAPSLDPRLET